MTTPVLLRPGLNIRHWMHASVFIAHLIRFNLGVTLDASPKAVPGVLDVQMM